MMLQPREDLEAALPSAPPSRIDADDWTEKRLAALGAAEAADFYGFDALLRFDFVDFEGDRTRGARPTRTNRTIALCASASYAPVSSADSIHFTSACVRGTPAGTEAPAPSRNTTRDVLAGSDVCSVCHEGTGARTGGR